MKYQERSKANQGLQVMQVSILLHNFPVPAWKASGKKAYVVIVFALGCKLTDHG